MKTNFKNESQQEMIQTETIVFTNPISVSNQLNKWNRANHIM